MVYLSPLWVVPTLAVSIETVAQSNRSSTVSRVLVAQKTMQSFFVFFYTDSIQEAFSVQLSVRIDLIKDKKYGFGIC